MYCQRSIDTLIYLGFYPLAVYNENTVGENADLQPLRENISQTLSNAATLAINKKSHIVHLL